MSEDTSDKDNVKDDKTSDSSLDSGYLELLESSSTIKSETQQEALEEELNDLNHDLDINGLINAINQNSQYKVQDIFDISMAFKSMSKRLSKITEEKRNLSNKNTALESQLLELSHVITSLSDENKRLKEMIKLTTDGAEIADKIEQFKEMYEKELKDVKDRNSAHIQQLNSHIEDLKDQLDKERDKTHRNMEGNMYINRLKTENMTLSNEIATIKERMTLMDIENSKLQSELDVAKDQIEMSHMTHENIKTNYEELLTNIHSKLTSYKSKNEDLKSENQRLTSENHKLKEAVECLTLTNENLTIQIQRKSEKIDKLLSTAKLSDEVKMKLDLYEELYTHQLKELESLCSLKNSMTIIISKLMNILERQPASPVHSKHFDSSNLEFDSTEDKRLLSELCRNDIMSKEEQVQFANSVEKLLNTLPDDLIEPVSNLRYLPIHQRLYETCSLLIDSLYNQSFSLKPQLTEAITTIKELRKKYNSLFCILENMVDILREIGGNSNGVNKLRIEIEQQCQRCALWMEKNKPDQTEGQMSIFSEDISRNPAELCKIIFSFITEGEEKRSPFAELLQLVSALTYANSMLMRRNDQIYKDLVEMSARLARKSDLQTRLDESRDKVKKLRKMLEDVKPVISRFVPEPVDDPEELLERFIINGKKGILSYRETEELYSQLSQLKAKVQSQQKAINDQKQEFINDKQLFCHAAAKRIEVLYKQVKQKVSDYKAHIKNLNKKYNELNHKLRYTEDQLVQAERQVDMIKEDCRSRIEKYDEKMSHYETSYTDMKSQLEKNQAIVAKNEENVRVIENYSNQIQKLKQEKKKLQIAATKYLKKLNKFVPQANQDIEDMKIVNEELTYKYHETVSSYASKLLESKEKLKESEDRIPVLEAKIQDLMSQNARLETQFRTCDYKRENAVKHCETISEENNAKLKALQISLEAKHKEELNSYSKKIDVCRKVLSFILAAELGISTSSKEDILDIAETAKQKFKEKTSREEYNFVVDAKRLHKSLQCDPKMLLSTVFQQLKDNEDKANERVKAIQKQLDLNSIELQRVNRENVRLSNSMHELSEWNTWARNVYRRFKDGTMCDINSETLRYMLTEFLMVSVSYKTIERRLSTLRAQKTLFVRNIVLPGRCPKPTSIQPIVAAVMFSHRLLEYGGFVPAKFALRQRKALDETNLEEL